MRDTVLSRMGQVVLSFMGVPRYSHQSIGDLQTLCLASLMRDRIAVATSQPRSEVAAKATGTENHSLTAPLVGIAIWANVSDAIDKKIRDQIGAVIFPAKLAAEDWTSGEIIWLLDVIAPSQKLSAGVLANFSQVLKHKLPKFHNGQINLHPIIKEMIGEDTLDKMGAKIANESSPALKKNPAAKKPSKKTRKKTTKKKQAAKAPKKTHFELAFTLPPIIPTKSVKLALASIINFQAIPTHVVDNNHC